MSELQIPKGTPNDRLSFGIFVIGISLDIGAWSLGFLPSVFHHRFPHGEADQQEHADDTDPDARFGEASSLSNHTVDERPREHHKDDEPGTQHGESAREQFQPAE